MAIIDCDAHVEESDETWSYMPPEWNVFRPFAVTFPKDTYFGAHGAAWVIDYKIRLYAANPTIMTRATPKSTSILIQEMKDTRGRMAAMEAGSEWTVPIVRRPRERRLDFIDGKLGDRAFVACTVDEDLPHTIDKVGVAFLVTQVDFPHGDLFREDHLQESLAERGDLANATIGKILSENPARLFTF